MIVVCSFSVIVASSKKSGCALNACRPGGALALDGLADFGDLLPRPERLAEPDHVEFVVKPVNDQRRPARNQSHQDGIAQRVPEPTVNYSRAAQPYGFDVFGPGGDIGSAPRDGFENDPFIAGEAVRWLRINASEARRTGRPLFMVASFVNPHDIMFGNGNVPGERAIEQGVTPMVLPPLPESLIYQRKWVFTLPQSLQESLTAPSMPRALLEYRQGWDGWSGTIPTDREDMWGVFYNYYLNCIRDEDRSVQQIVDVLDEMDLWRDTVVVFTADHGEMGAHGGLKGKGPFAYEANAHVPLLIAHPAGKADSATTALTSHLDLLPTFFGLTGLPEASRPAAVNALPGRDFSALLADPEKGGLRAVRPGVLFNYAGVSTVMAITSPKSCPLLPCVNEEMRNLAIEPEKSEARHLRCDIPRPWLGRSSGSVFDPDRTSLTYAADYGLLVSVGPFNSEVQRGDF